jgi:gliding motility-associated-like protein
MVRWLLFLFIALSAFQVRATHVMGGEITWTCNGNGYIFQLTFYRDCNGADVNPLSETLRVWNHPSITTINLLFVSRTDISPTCTPVAGSPVPLACGSGSAGGNGIGAVEKVIYKSTSIVLPGIPPSGTGWVFTYENFSRSGLITNLVNPTNTGLTIAATMFNGPNATPGVCMDNSPSFLQNPYLVSCAGDAYEYNLHPVDLDLDSISLSFGTPFNNFPTGTYNPPVNPNALAYEPGFSAVNPTPDASFDPANVPATLDPISGHLTFTSHTIGSFVVKVQAESFRQGTLIARVEREMQLIVVNCAGNNTAPSIAGPFAGLFETTVDAGTLVNFTLQATDIELLQDGTPQSNYLSVTSPQFGTNFTATTGCLNGPCATLSQSPVITGTQGATVDFSWQTACNHLLDAYGNVASDMPYVFVFKVMDNYCQIPKVTYKTITIHVRNPGIVPATTISCISTAPNGDLTVEWEPVLDPDGTFVTYNLYSVQNGLIGSFPLTATTAIIPAPTTELDFYVDVISGCNGNTTRTSDTVKNVFLSLFNPVNGTAQLSWNSPSSTPLPGMVDSCYVYREYPTGNWTLIGTVPYAQTSFIDTIDICAAFLNYSVRYITPNCQFNSNIVGDNLEDMMTPDQPILNAVSVDITTGNLTVSWNQNHQPDTYGYVIYLADANGILQELDTVWGISTTNYQYTGPVSGPMTFSVAAFDSCYTPATPPTYQTSAKGELHTSIFVSKSVNICNGEIVLNWSDYVGWNLSTIDYTIFIKQNSGSWDSISSVSGTSFHHSLEPLQNYCVAIRANHPDGRIAFSNLLCFYLNSPAPPDIHYLRVASVNGSSIDLRHEISIGSNVTAIQFERLNPLNNQFEIIGQVPATSSTLSFTDPDVSVQSNSYTYRAVVIDSCGGLGIISNLAKTVLLKITTDQNHFTNFLQWSEYEAYNGEVLQYEIIRGINGVFAFPPIAIVDPDQHFYADDVSAFDQTNGQFCYYIIAREAMNVYHFAEESFSNTECDVIDPLVYIPNAFTPEGVNPIFIPVVSFEDATKYDFSIVDRWGQVIFHTTDQSIGWDGKHQANNQLVELGVYEYVLRIADGNNQEYFYRGSVTLIR